LTIFRNRERHNGEKLNDWSKLKGRRSESPHQKTKTKKPWDQTKGRKEIGLVSFSLKKYLKLLHKDKFFSTMSFFAISQLLFLHLLLTFLHISSALEVNSSNGIVPSKYFLIILLTLRLTLCFKCLWLWCADLSVKNVGLQKIYRKISFTFPWSERSRWKNNILIIR